MSTNSPITTSTAPLSVASPSLLPVASLPKQSVPRYVLALNDLGAAAKKAVDEIKTAQEDVKQEGLGGEGDGLVADYGRNSLLLVGEQLTVEGFPISGTKRAEIVKLFKGTAGEQIKAKGELKSLLNAKLGQEAVNHLWEDRDYQQVVNYCQQRMLSAACGADVNGAQLMPKNTVGVLESTDSETKLRSVSSGEFDFNFAGDPGLFKINANFSANLTFVLKYPQKGGVAVFDHIETDSPLLDALLRGKAAAITTLKISWYYSLLQEWLKVGTNSANTMITKLALIDPVDKNKVQTVLTQLENLGFNNIGTLPETAFHSSTEVALQNYLNQLEILTNYKLPTNQYPAVLKINLEKESDLNSSFVEIKAIKAIREREDALIVKTNQLNENISALLGEHTVVSETCRNLLTSIQQNTKLDLAVRENAVEALAKTIDVIKKHPEQAIALNGIVTSMLKIVEQAQWRPALVSNPQPVRDLLSEVGKSITALSTVNSDDVRKKGLLVVNEALLEANRDVRQTAKTISTIGNITLTLNNAPVLKPKENGFFRFLKGVAGFFSIAAGVVVQIVSFGTLGSGLITKGRELMGIPEETALSKAVKGFEVEAAIAKSNPVLVPIIREEIAVALPTSSSSVPNLSPASGPSSYATTASSLAPPLVSSSYGAVLTPLSTSEPVLATADSSSAIPRPLSPDTLLLQAENLLVANATDLSGIKVDLHPASAASYKGLGVLTQPGLQEQQEGKKEHELAVEREHQPAIAPGMSIFGGK